VPQRRWYVLKAGRWKPDATQESFRQVRNLVRELGGQDSFRAMKRVERLARSDPRLAVAAVPDEPPSAAKPDALLSERPAYRIASSKLGDPNQFVIWCDSCRGWHWHGGRPGPNSWGAGHRVAHCHEKASPYRNAGYVLVDAGEPSPALRRAIKANMRPKSAS
ncbi:MAG: hypothetical protein HC861_05785, partial [Rhodospirillaceae bacterium]|nr:hypothetical protein [Rhodospirillaceae bacterium]